MTASHHEFSAWCPLTAAAREIALAHHLDPDNPCFNTAECVELDGHVDVEALRDALRLAYTEHPTLRAEVARGGAGFSWRSVEPSRFLDRIEILPRVRIEASPEAARKAVLGWCSEAAARPLDPATGRTVASALLDCGGRLWLYHCVHHLVADGFAVFEFLRRVGQLYGRLASGLRIVPEIRPGLDELAEQDRRDAPQAAADVAAWTDRLTAEGTEEDYSLAQRSAPPSPAAHRTDLVIDADLQGLLAEAGRPSGDRWPTVVIAAAGSYLARALGRQSARFGVPQMNRALPGGQRVTARAACTAVTVLPVRVAATGPAAEQLAEVRRQLAFSRRHGLARHEDLERWCSTAHGRLFGAQINVIPFDAVVHFGQIAAPIHNVTAGPVPDLTVCVRGLPGKGHHLSLEVTGNPALYTREDVSRHACRLRRWLGQWARVAAGDGDTTRLDQALPEELEALRAFNRTRRPHRPRTLFSRFEEQSQRTPHRTAVIEGPVYAAGSGFGGRRITYAELRETARAVAANLEAAGVRPGQTVALRTDRGLEQFGLLYGLMYAGAVYLPIDPSLPARRVADMLEDADGAFLIEGPGLPRLRFPAGTANGLVRLAGEQLLRGFEGASALAAGHRSAPAGHTVEPRDRAYIQFTSGSTGRPKAVPITHEALDHRLRWQQHLMPLGPSDRVVHKTAISFDVHVWELYWPLQESAAVVIAAPEGHKDPEYLARLMTQAGATCLHFVPTMLSAFLASPAARRILSAHTHRPTYVVCSGEALTRDHVRGARELLGTFPLNLYGPTEATIDVTSWDTSADPEAAVVPIGRPAWNTRCHVVDRAGHLCPPGIPGELCLSGTQIMEGYLNRPDADAAAFEMLRYGTGETATKVYRTGDLAVWRQDGVLEYRGRLDHQVKIRGQRLELGEVESVLADAPGVGAAAVLVHGSGGQQILVAYLQGDGRDPEVLLDGARRHAEARLPAYMIPSLWDAVEDMPVTTNGKTDRRALASRPVAPPESGGGPESLLEERMCALFAEVLGLRSVGRDTDFFSAGGASLSALELCARIEEHLGDECSLAQVFAHPTPRALTGALGGAVSDGFDSRLLLRRGTDPTARPIVFLPPAGGLGWCYAALLRELEPRRTIWALQDRRFSEPEARWPTDIGALAEEYLDSLASIAPSGCVLAGWSVGGIAAAEVASRAAGRGIPLERVVLLDAYPPAYWRTRAEPGDADLWIGLMRMGGVDPVIPPTNLEETVEALREHGSALAALDDEALRTCIGSVRRAIAYTRGRDTTPTDTSVILYAARASLEDGADPGSWGAFVGAVDLRVVPGDHAAMFAGDNRRLVAEALNGDPPVSGTLPG